MLTTEWGHFMRYLSDLAHDTRHALRTLRHRWGFALTTMLPLALGLGAATAMFSVVDGVMLRPLPFPHPEELVTIWATEGKWQNDKASPIEWDRVVIGQEDYRAVKERARTLSAVAAWGRSGGMLGDASGNFAPVNSVQVTGEIFDVLNLRPLLGRTIEPGENVMNGPAVALLSWEAWQKRFGGDSAIVGRSITYDERPVTVIGILPPGARLQRQGSPPALWLPAFQNPYDAPEHHNRSWQGLARLAPGASIETASREVGQIIADVKTAWKGSPEGTGGRVVSYQDDEIRNLRPSLMILTAAVALLLLIACVNLAIILFSEAARRQPEIAARTALGAGPGRLSRQLLTESLVIAGGGAILGSTLGWGLVRLLVSLAPANIPGLSDVRFDLRVFGFTAGAAILTGVASGILPVWALLRWGSPSLLGGAGRSTARSERMIHRALVGTEVALSLVMLVGCALLGRSLLRLSQVDPGFSPRGLLTVDLDAPRSLWSDSAAVEAFTAATLRELAAIPGVTAVSGSNSGMFNGNWSSSPLKVAGRGEDQAAREIRQRVVLPGYFHTLGVPVVAGRDFGAEDNASSTPVAILSQAAVQRDFPGESPLGKRVIWQGKEWTVIGVAADVQYDALDQDLHPTIYVPSRQRGGDFMSFLVRAGGTADGGQLVRTIRERIHALNPTVGTTAVEPVSTLVRRSYREESYRALLGTLFGVMGTVLAAFGLYGVIARSVAQRMREAGIRAALGATARSIAQLMLRETAIGVAIGLGVGLPLAALAARRLTPYLFGVTTLDPVAYLAAFGLFGFAALVATLPSARKAGQADPASVLKSD